MTNKKYLIIILILFSSMNIATAQDINSAAEEKSGSSIEESYKIIDTQDAAAGDNREDGEVRNRSLVTFTVWDFFRMVFVLVFVAGCIYALVFLLKKASAGRFEESELINIISSKSINTGKTLHIVEVGNQMMIIGVSEESISHISDITDKETYEMIKLHKGENTNPRGDTFYSYLSKVINPGGRKKTKSGDIHELLEKQKKRMEKL